MATWLFLVVLVPLAAAALLTRLGLSLLGVGNARAITPEAKRATRSIGIALAAATVIAIAAASYLVSTDRFGRGVLLVVPVSLIALQLGLSAATVIISTTVRSPGSIRVAGLSTRRVTDTTPRVLAAATVLGVLVSLVLAVTACSVASVDEFSGEYRYFASRTETGSQSFGPFAGSFYSIPLAVVLLLSVLITAGTLLGARRWGALNQPDLDLALRLGISTRTVAATAMCVGSALLVLGGSLAEAASQVAHSPDDSTLWAIARVAMPVTALGGIGLGIWAFIAFLFPTFGHRART